ncbi:GNAT family N-acetyltransferase [uncultured Roseobacter sp.]|uniref:GNAT family N-acetyltransferase n=1 Tax=uncultured Roseobacter sp. TaxID=114847 RepID=UPI002627F24D|nr:GNAT family N-acetyltransferase [uncultured Roseobacter sp.]
MEKSVFSGRIRPVRSDDLQVVLEMVSKLADFHGDVATVTADELARDILGPHPWVRILLAEEAGKVVGYAALCPLAQMQFGARGMDMHHLYVAKSARGTGVGKALIKASEALARAEGCRYLMVGTHPDNIVAQGIYLAMGFDRLDQAGPRFRIKLAAA